MAPVKSRIILNMEGFKFSEEQFEMLAKAFYEVAGTTCTGIYMDYKYSVSSKRTIPAKAEEVGVNHG